MRAKAGTQNEELKPGLEALNGLEFGCDGAGFGDVGGGWAEVG